MKFVKLPFKYDLNSMKTVVLEDLERDRGLVRELIKEHENNIICKLGDYHISPDHEDGSFAVDEIDDNVIAIYPPFSDIYSINNYGGRTLNIATFSAEVWASLLYLEEIRMSIGLPGLPETEDGGREADIQIIIDNTANAVSVGDLSMIVDAVNAVIKDFFIECNNGRGVALAKLVYRPKMDEMFTLDKKDKKKKKKDKKKKK